MNPTAMIMVLGISILIGFLNLLTSSVVNCIGRKSLFIGLQVSFSNLFVLEPGQEISKALEVFDTTDRGNFCVGTGI